MSGALQVTFQNMRSFAASVPTVIGEAFGGGFYAGQISTAGNGTADYYLITGPIASAQGNYQWKTSDTTTAGTTSVIDGPANSAAMNNASHPAAQFCEGLTVGGNTDWYLPAKNELEVCYFNLKPTTQANNTSSGINPNAVPARASSYPGGSPATNPARTSAADFQAGGAQAYNIFYWSSTELTSTNASRNYFAYGGQYSNTKTATNLARGVRRVAV